MEGLRSDIETWLNANPLARDIIVVGCLLAWFAGVDILSSHERVVVDGILFGILLLALAEAAGRLTGDSLFEYFFQKPIADPGVRKWLEEHPLARDLLAVVTFIGIFTGLSMHGIGELRSSGVFRGVLFGIVGLIVLEAQARSKGNSIFWYFSSDSVPE